MWRLFTLIKCGFGTPDEPPLNEHAWTLEPPCLRAFADPAKFHFELTL
jgi:hypothetical protein